MEKESVEDDAEKGQSVMRMKWRMRWKWKWKKKEKDWLSRVQNHGGREETTCEGSR